jgi:uncharacterized protein (TIGR02996 family)
MLHAVADELAELLGRLEEHLARGERQAAHAAARDAWRQLRSPELATLVEKVVATLRSTEPLIATSVGGRQEEWVARARRGNALDLPVLLEDLAEQAEARRASHVALRVDELARFADDPALTRALMPLIGNWVTRAWTKAVTHIFKALVATGDPRLLAWLGDAPLEGSTLHESVLLVERRAKARARIAASYPEIPVTPPDVAQRVEEILATLVFPQPPPAELPATAGSPRDEELLAAIYAQPDDEGALAVYADVIQARRDPRGELIVAQLTAARGGQGAEAAARRAETILRKHRTRLVGPLARVVVLKTAVFERGFLARCETNVARKVEADAVVDCPEWGTVRSVTFRGRGTLSPHMQNVEAIPNITSTDLLSLRGCGLPRLKTLGVVATQLVARGHPLPPGLRLLVSENALPAVTSLRLDLGHASIGGEGPDDYGWLHDSWLGVRLESLGCGAWLSSHPDLVVRWADHLRAAPTPLRRVTLSHGAIRVTLVKRDGRVAAEITKLGGPYPRDLVDAVEQRCAQVNASAT